MKPKLFLLLLSVTASLVAQAEPLSLWYKQPARRWLEALPIGNGNLGGMVFGGVTNEHVQFNEQTLWLGDEVEMGSYQPFGDLFIDWKHGESSAFRRELDLRDASHVVTYQADGATFRREYFASHPAQAMVLRFTADKPAGYSGAIRLTDVHKAEVSAEKNTLMATGALSNGLAYEARVLVLNEGGTVTSRDGIVRIDKADAVTILLVAGTSFANDPMKNWRGDHPHARLVARLDAAAKIPFERLRADHVTDVRRLFDRVTLDLGDGRANLPTDERLATYKQDAADRGLEALLFQYGRYLLIASSRPGGLPANLQGIWNADTKPAWYSGYTANINVEMNYWLAELTGLSECHEPLFQWIRNMGVVYRRTKDERVKAPGRGWSSYSTTNPMGGTSHWGVHRPNSAWLVQHLWLHYAFTGDKDFLRTIAYPEMKDVVGFWEERLIEGPNHTLITPDGWSPEHGPVTNGNKIVLKEGDRTPHPGVSYDQQIVWDLFNNYVEAATALHLDADYRAKIAGMRDRLLGPNVGRWGQIQEWMEDVDDPKDKHRHTSHLFGLHPGRQISPLTTPALAEAAKVTLNGRGDVSTGWSTAWKMNFWARLHDGDRAHQLCQQLFKQCILDNLFDTHPPFQIDGNFGYSSGVAEMLLQSHVNAAPGSDQPLIHLLPALPVAWKDGSVQGLHARGGFTVDVAWKDGRITTYRITSTEPRDLTLRIGNETKRVRSDRAIVLPAP